MTQTGSRQSVPTGAVLLQVHNPDDHGATRIKGKILKTEASVEGAHILVQWMRYHSVASDVI
jgi:hypothetical protein